MGRLAACTVLSKEWPSRLLSVGDALLVVGLLFVSAGVFLPLNRLALAFSSCAIASGTPASSDFGILPGGKTCSGPLRVSAGRKLDGLRRQGVCNLWTSLAPPDIDVLAQSFLHEVPVFTGTQVIGFMSALQTAAPERVLGDLVPVPVPCVAHGHYRLRCLPSQEVWHWSMVRQLHLCWQAHRGGMFRDHTLQEQVGSMESRLKQIQEMTRGLLSDFDNLKQRIRSRSPPPMERAVLPLAEPNDRDMPDQEPDEGRADLGEDRLPPTQPDDIDQAEAFVELVNAQEEDLGSEGASQYSPSFSPRNHCQDG